MKIKVKGVYDSLLDLLKQIKLLIKINGKHYKGIAYTYHGKYLLNGSVCNYEFLGAYSLEPSRKDITVTIKTINKEQHRTHGGKLDEFTVAYFVEGIKPMILNKTNCSALEKLFGPYPENWEGKQITIYIATGIRNPNGGGYVEALRIRTSAPKVAAKTKSLPMASDAQYQKVLSFIKKGDVKKYSIACTVVNFTDQQHKEINEIIESIM